MKLPAYTLVVFLTFPPLAAQAAPRSRVDELTEQGLAETRLGNKQKALELFEEAYSISPSTTLMIQRALAEDALGQWAAASEHLSAALANPGGLTEAQRHQLDGVLEKIRLNTAELVVEGTPDGAEVWVQGVSRGTLPLSGPIRIDPGESEIRLEASGYEKKIVRRKFSRGTKARIDLHLSSAPLTEVNPGALGPPPLVAVPAESDLLAAPAPVMDHAPPPAPPSGPLPAWLGYTAAASAIGLAGFGTWWLASRPSCDGPSAEYVCIYQPRPPGVAIAAFVGAVLLGAGGIYVVVSDHGAQVGARASF